MKIINDLPDKNPEQKKQPGKIMRKLALIFIAIRLLMFPWGEQPPQNVLDHIIGPVLLLLIIEACYLAASMFRRLQKPKKPTPKDFRFD